MAEMPTADVDARRAFFLTAGIEYDRARPDYPLEAIEWLVGSGEAAVVDLGCGSGKLTHQLAQLGHAVIGVDPSLEMLRVLLAKRLRGVCGRAEALPLREACADIVTAAQAFHWFDHDHAVPEMRRILRRGGRVGLLWNLRDETVEWVQRLSDIIGSEDAVTSTCGPLDELEAHIKTKRGHGDGFGGVEHRTFDHRQELSVEGLIALIRSRSYVAILPENDQRAILSAVRSLCREHPQLKDRETFFLPYKTRTFRVRLS
jgi:SAM-dependent methyltransferase